MILKIAKKVLDIESRAIQALIDRLDDNFVQGVELLVNCEGKVIVAGLGKSGIIAGKLAASLTSTGTPAFFLHATEAVHGGLGIFSPGDILVTYSYSGKSSELEDIIAYAKRLNLKVISITGDKNSEIAKISDVSICVKVRSEASSTIPFLPTASTTAMLAMSDALMVALLEKKGFYESDFAKVHPAGSIGKRLKIINELMHVKADVPLVDVSASLYDVMEEITKKNFGLTGVIDNDQLVGVITDADIRRFLIKNPILENIKASDVMTKDPKVICEKEVATKAIALFEKFTITSLFVVEKKNNRKVVGYIHLKDLMKAKVI